MIWIILSLIAALFYALRFIIVKKFLSETDTLLIAFAARLAGAFFLLPTLFFFPIASFDAPQLWTTIIITALFTAVASIMQITAIKKYDISSSVPFLSFTPLFMTITVFIIFKESPDIKAAVGLLFLCCGSAFINKPPKNRTKKSVPFLHNYGSLLFLGVAAIYGLTTTLDRIAIEKSNAVTYALFWNIFSTLIFLPIFFNRKKWRAHWEEIKKKSHFFLIQGFLGVVAFACQMFAVQYAKKITANVIYVKALTMLQLLLAVIFGIILFREKNGKRKISASLLMILGAFIIILYHKK